jgi:deoxyribonuclease-4
MADKLRFGTGGIPLTTHPKSVIQGVRRIAELGLEHMELEFVQSIYVKEEQAPELKKVAEESNVTLSVHGSYYVNLAADDKAKWHAGINRVIQAAERGAQCGAVSVTYHSGFIQGKPMDEVYATVKEGTKRILDELKSKNVNIHISPELTGKAAQFGDLPDLVKLVKELRGEGYGDQIGLCIDFAHKYARDLGKYNSHDQFMEMLELVGTELGTETLHDLHIHMSGIEYGDKGEKNHVLYLPKLEDYVTGGIKVDRIDEFVAELDMKRFNENKFDWQGVFQALKKMDVRGYVVCESPALELDALWMQKYYLSL